MHEADVQPHRSNRLLRPRLNFKLEAVKDSSLRARVVAIAALGIFQQMPISDAARRKLRASGHSSTLA